MLCWLYSPPASDRKQQRCARKTRSAHSTTWRKLVKWIKKLTALALILLVTSCAISSPITKRETDGCEWVEYIKPTNDDIVKMSDDLVKQILAHDKKVKAMCPKKPKP